LLAPFQTFGAGIVLVEPPLQTVLRARDLCPPPSNFFLSILTGFEHFITGFQLDLASFLPRLCQDMFALFFEFASRLLYLVTLQSVANNYAHQHSEDRDKNTCSVHNCLFFSDKFLCQWALLPVEWIPVVLGSAVSQSGGANLKFGRFTDS